MFPSFLALSTSTFTYVPIFSFLKQNKTKEKKKGLFSPLTHSCCIKPNFFKHISLHWMSLTLYHPFVLQGAIIWPLPTTYTQLNLGHFCSSSPKVLQNQQVQHKTSHLFSSSLSNSTAFTLLPRLGLRSYSWLSPLLSQSKLTLQC